MDKFHEPKLVALTPPTYVLRVWFEACTYAWIGNVGGGNVYQVMLRDGPLKRDTNRSAQNIPSLAPLLVRYHLQRQKKLDTS
jgi:hypothetical protein